MTRMRDSMPVILFGLLIAFLITIVFEWGMDYLGTRSAHADIIGKVNGKTITYKEFSEFLKNVTDNQKAQSGKELDDEALRQARDQVWQSLVTQQVVSDEIRRLGITVTDQEIIDWVRGDNPPEDLKRNFVDSTGQFRKDLYDQFLSNPNQFIRDPNGANPNYGTQWLADYEKSLRVRRSQEKLQSVVLASVRVTPGELYARFTEQNQKFDAMFALFDANILVKDADVQVTDADIKSYYDENLEQYKIGASRTLKYVFLAELPSASDSAARQSEIDDLAKKARTGMDFIELTYTNADKADSGAFFRHGELGSDLETPLFNARVGDVVGPILDAKGYHLMKVLDERRSATEYVHASHILFTVDPSRDSVQTKKTAQRVAQEARQGRDFAALARQYSQDQSNAQRGGDLGWFPKGRMVKAFDDAVFKGKPGEVIGPVRTQFGWHVIKVLARDSRELKVSAIVLPIDIGSQTKNDIFQRSQDFAYNAKESEFVKEAQASGLEVKETQVQEKGGMVPGLGINESITRWAFENRVGSVSEPYTIGNGYAVFSVAQARDAGVRPLDEVKESIRPLALRKNKIDRTMQIAAELRSKLSAGDSLARISAFRPDVRVIPTGPITLSGAVPGLGRDPNFFGAVLAMEPGQISQPVRSLRGALLIQLVSRTAVDSAAFAAQRDALRNQMLQEKKNRFLADWIEKLKAEADVQDRRDLFFR